jgi:hypothetical protein
MANNEKIINKLWHNEVGRVERIGGGRGEWREGW